MKALIYTVATTPRHREQAELLEKSIREFGHYVGHFRRVPDFDTSDYPHPNAGYMGRVLAGRKMNVSGYDVVTYLDSDILAVGNIGEILTIGLSGLAAFPEIPLTQDNWSKWLPSWVGGPKLERGFNSGCVVGPAAQWHLLCKLWFNEILRIQAWNEQCWDQNALNSLVLTKAITLRQMPSEWCCFTRDNEFPVGPDTRLIHFNHGDNRLQQMSVAYNLRKL